MPWTSPPDDPVPHPGAGHQGSHLGAGGSRPPAPFFVCASGGAKSPDLPLRQLGLPLTPGGEIEGAPSRRAARRRVHETASDTRHKERVVDLKLNSVLEGLVVALEHAIELLGLNDCSWETVKNEAVIVVSRCL